MEWGVYEGEDESLDATLFGAGPGEDAGTPVPTGGWPADDEVDAADAENSDISEDISADVRRAAGEVAGEQPDVRGRRLSRRWLGLTALTILYMANMAHRQLTAVLLPAGMRCGASGANSTRGDCIELSHSEVGFLLGPGFSVPFVLGGLPISWLSDRYSRKTVLTVVAVSWISTVLASAWVNSFGVLLLLRAALGAFEAGYSPCAYVLQSELFPLGDTRRSLAFSLYHTAVYLGFGSSYFAGMLSQASGWRVALIVFAVAGYAGLPGILAVKESRPSELGAQNAANRKTPGSESFWAVARELFAIRPYAFLVAGTSATFFSRFAIAAYLPTFYHNHFGLSPTLYGPSVGVIIIVAGCASILLGGTVSDRCTTDRHKSLVCVLSQWIPLPFWISALLVSTEHGSFACLFFAMFFGDFFLGIAAAMLQAVVPSRLRSRASMFYLGTNTLIGGMGPLTVGLTLEHHPDARLDYVLVSIITIGFTLSGVFFYLVGKSTAAPKPAVQLRQGPAGTGSEA